MVCLDTDFLIAYMRNSPAVKAKLEHYAKSQEPICTTTINAFELYKGAHKSKRTTDELAKIDMLLGSFIILTLSMDSAKLAGVLYNKSNMIGEADLLIGSIAMSNKQVLATRNKRHFERIPGLKIDEW